MEGEAAKRPRRGRRGGRGRPRARGEEGATDEDAGEDRPEPAGDQVVEGVVELLANGSGFIRLAPPEPTDDDVYISAAQVKRCELVSGDRIAGPMRSARRSERFPSLIRVDTINGRPADEVAEGTRFEDLPAVFPSERFELGSEDPTVEAIQWLTPFGRGSRVVISGPARSGKSEALRRLAGALAAQEGLELSLVLVGVRPEEVGEAAVEPAAALSFAASADAQSQAVEQAIEQGRRVAARGGDAVVLIDTLDHTARARGAAGARGGAQHRRRRLADRDRHCGGAGGRRDDRRRAGPVAGGARSLPRGRPRRLRRAPPRAAGRRRGRRGDRQGARGAAARLTAGVRDPVPVGLGRQLDRLVVALRLDVAEGARGVVVDDVELAFLHALVEPGGAEHEPAQPVHE